MSSINIIKVANVNCSKIIYSNIKTLLCSYSIVLNSAWESKRKCVACEKCTYNIQNVVSCIRYSACMQPIIHNELYNSILLALIRS